MSSQEKESYKDYLVRTVTQEIGNIFNQKMDEARRELKDINYKLALENTEEILKNYKKLKDHITMTDEEKNTLKQNFESLVDKMIAFETTTSSENIEEAN